MKRILSLKEMVEVREKLKADDKKVVFTNGVFDVLHVGHLKLLSAAREFGDVLVVGLNSDDSVRRLKGKSRPINKFRDRAVLLSELRSVDYVVKFSQDTPLELILRLKPDALVKGADYAVDEIVGAREVLGWGGEVHRVRIAQGYSSSSVIRRL